MQQGLEFGAYRDVASTSCPSGTGDPYPSFSQQIGYRGYEGIENSHRASELLVIVWFKLTEMVHW